MRARLEALLRRLENSRLAPLVQFVKFGLVGLSNTAISYGIDLLGYYAVFRNSTFPRLVTLLEGLGIRATGEQVKVVIVTAAAFTVSVLNSYFWNSRFVFKSGTRKTFGQHAAALLRMAACYAVTGLLLSPWLKLLLSGAGWPYWLASLGSMVVVIPLNYVLNKFWAFGRKKGEEE